MKNLNISREEAIEVYNADKAIDKGEKLFELSAEQKKTAKKYTTTGTKTVYQFNERKRKPNDTKREIIEELYKFIENMCGNAEITNPERQIAFSFNDNKYELTLVQKRK